MTYTETIRSHGLQAVVREVGSRHDNQALHITLQLDCHLLDYGRGGNARDRRRARRHMIAIGKG